MNELKDITVRINDWGLFTFLAERFVGQAKKVEYFVQWRGPFPTSDRRRVGEGIPDVKRLDSFWDGIEPMGYARQPRLFVYPDFYLADEQKLLRSLGYPVFGCGDSEKLERDREFFKDTLDELGLPNVGGEYCRGTEVLREYLESLPKNAKLVVKTSDFRGDFETTPIDGENRTIETFLKSLPELAVKLDVNDTLTKFICEPWIESDCEPGWSEYNCNGVPSDYGMLGYEKKGDALLGRMFKSVEAPEPIRKVNEKIYTVLKKLGCQGFYVMEYRITKRGVCCPIDICMRAGSPDVEVLSMVDKDFPLNVLRVANSQPAKMKLQGLYTGILKFHSGELKTGHDLEIRFPREIAPYVKIRNWQRKNGRDYSISQDAGDNAGAVVAWGDSMNQVEDLCMKRIEQIHCEGMEYTENAFEDIEKSISAGRKYGIDF